VDGVVGGVGLGAGDVEAVGGVAGGADALDGVVAEVRCAVRSSMIASTRPYWSMMSGESARSR
jgi:hypothetical protein